MDTVVDFRECPSCYIGSPIGEWIVGEIYCEDCGTHPAATCPECKAKFDLIFNDFIDFMELDD